MRILTRDLYSSPSMNTIKFPESSDIEDYDKDDDYTSGYDSDEAEETPLESPDHSYKKLSIVKETIDLTEDSDGSYIGPRGLSEDEICTDAAVINLEKLRSNPTFDKPCEISEDECIGGDKVESCEDGHSDGPCDSYVDITDSQYDSEDEGEDEDRQIPISFATENSTDNDLESRIKSHNQNGEMNTGYANEEVRLSHIRSNLDEIGYTSSPVEGKPSVVSNEDNVRNGSSGNTTKELAYDSDTGFPEVHFHEDSWAYPGISDTQRFSMDEINRKADNNAAFDSSSSAQANRAPEPSGSTIAENGKPMLASTSFHFATTHFMRDGDLEKITQKTLGDKTGKQVYFEAREKNRESILNAIDQSSSPQGFPFGDQNWYSHCEDIDQPSASVCLGGTSVQSEKAPLPSIDNKADVPDPLSNQISSTADASTQKSYNEPQSSFPVQVPSPSKPTKRKADAISTIQDDEIRAWAESNDGLSNTSADVPIQSHVPARVGINDDAVSEQRTSKKVKRFAEAMGYAALGGVAVGAGLFSVLVATAPDFI